MVQRSGLCGLGTDRAQSDLYPRSLDPVTLVLPEPCGAALDRIHLIKQQRIRAWRVNLGLCHLRPSFLFSGPRPGSPRRLPSDAFIASCCEGIDIGDVKTGSRRELPEGPVGHSDILSEASPNHLWRGGGGGGRASERAPSAALPSLHAFLSILHSGSVIGWVPRRRFQRSEPRLVQLKLAPPQARLPELKDFFKN